MFVCRVEHRSDRFGCRLKTKRTELKSSKAVQFRRLRGRSNTHQKKYHQNDKVSRDATRPRRDDKADSRGFSRSEEHKHINHFLIHLFWGWRWLGLEEEAVCVQVIEMGPAGWSKRALKPVCVFLAIDALNLNAASSGHHELHSNFQTFREPTRRNSYLSLTLLVTVFPNTIYQQIYLDWITHIAHIFNDTPHTHGVQHSLAM